MQTLTFRETVGEDGVLRLQIPAQSRGEVEVVVVIQAQNGSALSQPLDWIEATYGSLRDETYEIPEELPWENNRLPIE